MDHYMILRAPESGSSVIKRSISMELRNERSRRDWRIINRACRKSRAGTISAVDVKNGYFYISTEGRMEAEREIQTFKVHFIADICGTHTISQCNCGTE